MKYNFKVERGNIFDYVGIADCICITTNGTIKSNGELVMGAGVAKQFYDKYNDKFKIAKTLGILLSQSLTPPNKMIVVKDENNICYNTVSAKDNYGTNVTSFPTKNHFHDKGNMELIKQSAKRMVYLANKHGLKHIVIPSPGTGCGKLKEEDVYKELNEILDERFTIIKR